MATVFQGYGGSLAWVTTTATVGQVQGWSLTINQEIADASGLGDKWAQPVGAGRGSWSGSMDVIYAGTTNQVSVINQVLATTPAAGATAVFTVAASQTITGIVIITSVNVVHRTDTVCKITADFVGQGEPVGVGL